MLLGFRQVVLHALALEMQRQRLTPARLGADYSRCTRGRLFIRIVFWRFRLGQRNTRFGCKQRQLLTRKLLAFGSGLGLQQLPQQTFAAIQLRSHIHQHPLQGFRILGQCLRIDWH
jgi:hypothetical protein